MSWSAIPSNPATTTVAHVGAPYEGGIQFAFDATGANGVVAWVEVSGSTQTSYARRLVSGSWQARETVWAGEAQTHNAVAALVDDSGAPCVALSRGGWYFATFHRYASGSWSQVGAEFGGSGGAATGIDFISTSEPEVCQMVGYGGTNNRSVMIFFKSRDGLRIARTINGTTQSGTLLNSTGFGATIGKLVKISNTEFHAIGRLADNRIAHWSSTDAGATWSNANIIASGSNAGSDVRADLQADGSILAVWSLTSGSGATAWSRYASASWSTPAAVAGPSDAITTGNVNFAGDTLTYGKLISGVTQVCAKRFASGAWGSETQLTTEASSLTHHGMSSTPNGNELAIAYQSGNDIKVRRRVYGNWRTSQTIAANSTFWPQVVANGSTLGIHSGLTPQAITLDTTVPQQISAAVEIVGTSSVLSLASDTNLSSASDAAETTIGNALLRNTPLTGAATLYAALFTSYPGETGSLASEVSGNGYSRAQVSFGAPATPGVFTNDAVCLFPEATGAGWGTVSFIGIMDAETAGNLLLVLPLVTAAGDATSQAISANDRPEISPGDLTVQVV